MFDQFEYNASSFVIINCDVQFVIKEHLQTKLQKNQLVFFIFRHGVLPWSSGSLKCMEFHIKLLVIVLIRKITDLAKFYV